MSIATHHHHRWPTEDAGAASDWEDDVNAVIALLELEHEERERARNATIPNLPPQ